MIFNPKKEELLYWKSAYLRLALKAMETSKKLIDKKLKAHFLADAKMFGTKAKQFEKEYKAI
jgi:hypothetical protein